MKSYHNDAAIKDKYLNRVREHRRLDHLVQGVGWESNGVTRGCAVGCTLERYDHSRYPTELGLPEWLARLEDAIFEELPLEKALEWPERFLQAIPVGVNCEPVRYKLAIRRIDRLIALQQESVGKHTVNVSAIILQTIAALQTVRRCHEAEQQGNTCDWSAARSAARSAAESARSAAESARSAAWSAAESARSAAWSAAWSAAESAAESARSAAWSAARSAAWSAESAAESAARSAESAAESAEWSAAWSAEWIAESDDLTEILQSLHVD